MFVMLKTESDTPEMEERVREAAYAQFDLEPSSVFFEHGHWWVRFSADWDDDGDFEEVFGSDEAEITFSVVDASGYGSVDGFSFERV